MRRVKYRPRIASLGEPTLDLQHATRIAGTLEDEELASKLALRK